MKLVIGLIWGFACGTLYTLWLMTMPGQALHHPVMACEGCADGTVGWSVDGDWSCEAPVPIPVRQSENPIVWIGNQEAFEPMVTTPGTTEDIPPWQYTNTGALKIDRASFDAMLRDYPDAMLRVMLTDDSCLAQMEAAMRAAQPYQNYYLNDGTIIHSPFKGMPADVLKLWEETAKTCWRQP